MKKITLMLLFLLTSEILFCTNNWVVTYAGHPNTLRGIHFINSSSGYCVGDGVFLKTINGGINWVTSLSRYNLKDVYFLDNQTGFAVGKSNDSGFVLKTTNNGVSWTSYYLGGIGSNDEYGSIFFRDNNTGYIVLPMGGYYRTTNGGLSWIIKTFPNENIRDVKWIGSLFYKIGSYPVSSYYKPAYCTSTNETNWSSVSYCSQCSNNEYGVTYYQEDSVKYFVTEYPVQLRRSTVANPSWQSIGASLGSSYFIPLFINSASLHYGIVLGSNSNIYSSSNSGYNWVRDTILDFHIRDLYFFDLATGFAVSENGLIAKTTNGGGTIGIQTISSEIPKSYQLKQNYPNPFNPVTNIKFDIINKGIVKLTIYDILGHEIATLINQELQSGSYKVDWDATNFPSGVYTYRIENDKFTQSKKMILLK